MPRGEKAFGLNCHPIPSTKTPAEMPVFSDFTQGQAVRCAHRHSAHHSNSGTFRSLPGASSSHRREEKARALEEITVSSAVTSCACATVAKPIAASAASMNFLDTRYLLSVAGGQPRFPRYVPVRNPGLKDGLVNCLFVGGIYEKPSHLIHRRASYSKSSS